MSADAGARSSVGTRTERLTLVQQNDTHAFPLQEIVAERVIHGLGLDLLQGEGSRVQTDVPRNPLAYQHYLRSLAYPHGYGRNELALPQLEKCIELDPGYAPAYAELGSRRELAAVYGLGGEARLKEAEQA